MAVTLYQNGNPTLVVGTENFVYSAAGSSADVGTFEFIVDKTNMAAGDVLEMRVYYMVLTTQRVLYLARYTGAQPTDDMIAASVPFSNADSTDANAFRVSLLQTKGTGRAVPWNLLKFA